MDIPGLLNKNSVRNFRALLSQPNFLNYSHIRFLKINELEERRRPAMRHEAARRNAKLNRYCNIVPFDYNRIDLKDTRFGKGGDYINASYIVSPYDINRTYIATQGPLESTLLDFWRMVIEQHVEVIVCLTPQSENGIEKCARYWPLENHPLTLSNERVTLKVSSTRKEFKDERANSIVREIAVEFYNNATKELIIKSTVTQFHYLGWPDHGVPNETDSVINLIKLTRQINNHAPIVVHCSAGCGRTGTFCVIDTAEELLRVKDLAIDPVFILTDEFRKQRTTMVQAKAQFDFCYIALADFITQNEEDEAELIAELEAQEALEE